MKVKVHWLAASLFFLTGGLLYGVSALVRGLLYAAKMTQPSWSYPDPLVESMVPAYLHGTGNLAFVLSVAMIIGPYLIRLVAAELESGRQRTPNGEG